VITVDRKVVEVAGYLFVEAPKTRKFRRTIYPRRAPAGYPLAERLATQIGQARAKQEVGANPPRLIFRSRMGKRWRSSDFQRNVLQRADLAAGRRDGCQLGDRPWVGGVGLAEAGSLPRVLRSSPGAAGPGPQAIVGGAQNSRVPGPAPGEVSDGGVAIRVIRGLRKRYEDVEAVRGIDLTVRTGEIFAFLGPNGAGKTTTVETLEGYRSRDGGEVEVLGADPARPPPGWRACIGVVLQESEPEAELTVEECVSLYAGYYPGARAVAETLELVGLADRPTARCGRLSGGQSRRLDVALALIGDPELVFLDEPRMRLG